MPPWPSWSTAASCISSMPEPDMLATADTRGSIVVETGRIVEVTPYDGDQVVMRIRAPRIAARAQAGHFVHLRCSPDRPMRRPMWRKGRRRRSPQPLRTATVVSWVCNGGR